MARTRVPELIAEAFADEAWGKRAGEAAPGAIAPPAESNEPQPLESAS
jgi:hypothetical protein